ncbi:MAG: NAD(P)-binding domain-containing protein, partial [Chthoniobacterales bacterium]|nr:NAD(P)-binding domain-containing protein [Chthoniobacterales bacterium]
MPGLLARYTHWLHTQWPAGEVEKLPVSREGGVTDLPGVRIVGDLTGIPLLKFSSATGAGAVRAILAEPDFSPSNGGTEELLDLVIIGGGVAGMSAAIEAKKAGLGFVVLEAAEVFSTVVNFPKGKPIYTYPTEMKLDGGLQFAADVKEGLLAELQRQQREAGIEATPGRAERVERHDADLLVCVQDGKPLRARRVIIAIGRSGDYRRLGVPGEELDKVYNRLFDPKEFADQKALVVGGGDSALETAIALTTAGAEVTLSYRREEFSRAKPENVAKLNALASNPAADVQVEQPKQQTANPAMTRGLKEKASGSLKLALGTDVTRIESAQVFLKNGTEEALPNDVVFTMLGREAPLDFFRRSGIQIAGEGTRGGW